MPAQNVSAARRSIKNLVKRNWDFENVPVFTAATNTAVKWIDGTAAGGAQYGTGSQYGWAMTVATGTAAVQYDTTVSHNGNASLKVSTQAIASVATVGISPSGGNINYRQYAIPVVASTNYTLSFWMKTTANSGTATTGANFFILNRSGDMASLGTAITLGGQTTTTNWTQYSGSYTTSSITAFATFHIGVTGNDGTGTLVMDAWFDDIQFAPTSGINRNAVTS